MTFYLPNTDVTATGSEPAEFIDPTGSEGRGSGPVTREYVGAGITVHWDSGRCIHSENCSRGAPTVFDPAARPWVNLDDAEANDVARVIDTCPSGALTYTRTDGALNGRSGRAPGEDPTAALAPDPELNPRRTAGIAAEGLATITPQANGPLSVKGPVGLTRPDGSTQVAQRLLLCRCGQSASKPSCDGSHSRVGFTAPGVGGDSDEGR
jgi:uncharacterized Fe-S cluster protein YjdI/CDGSH-type Zn-finger protein